MSRKNLKLHAVVALVAAMLSAGAAPSAWAEAGGCMQPLSSGADPVVSDCLNMLRVAVKLINPSRPCIVQPRGTPTKVSDALLCLQYSVNLPVNFDCHCNAPGQPDLESTAYTFNPTVDIAPDINVTGHSYDSSSVTNADPWAINDTSIRSRFVKTRYLGAFSQDATPAKGDWTAGWSVEVAGNHTVWHPATEGTLAGATPSANSACPSGTTLIGTTSLPSPFVGSMDVCQLPGRYATEGGTLTLTNDNVYRLADLSSGGTLIGNGDFTARLESAPIGNGQRAVRSTLVIEPGTLILGDVQEALIITRGSQIFANGTKANPISMNSVTQWTGWKAGNDYTGRGIGTGARREWGGLVITGFGWVNFCVNGTTCDALVEGVAVNVAYGGKNETWNGGSVNYVEISNSGYDINGNGNDLNCLTLYALGAPTIISHVDCNNAGDDAFEFFGGNVVADHIIATGTLDDNLDSDVGFRGGAQFALIRQFSDDGDKGIEPDNGPNTDGNAHTYEPRSHPRFANITWIGRANNTGPLAGTSMSLRTGTGMLLANSLLGNSRRVELRSEQQSPTNTGTGSCQYAGPAGLNVQSIRNTWVNAWASNQKSAGGAAFSKDFEGVNATDFGCMSGLFATDTDNQTADPFINSVTGYPNQQ